MHGDSPMINFTFQSILEVALLSPCDGSPAQSFDALVTQSDCFSGIVLRVGPPELLLIQSLDGRRVAGNPHLSIFKLANDRLR